MVSGGGPPPLSRGPSLFSSEKTPPGTTETPSANIINNNNNNNNNKIKNEKGRPTSPTAGDEPIFSHCSPHKRHRTASSLFYNNNKKENDEKSIMTAHNSLEKLYNENIEKIEEGTLSLSEKANASETTPTLPIEDYEETPSCSLQINVLEAEESELPLSSNNNNNDNNNKTELVNSTQQVKVALISSTIISKNNDKIDNNAKNCIHEENFTESSVSVNEKISPLHIMPKPPQKQNINHSPVRRPISADVSKVRVPIPPQGRPRRETFSSANSNILVELRPIPPESPKSNTHQRTSIILQKNDNEISKIYLHNEDINITDKVKNTTRDISMIPPLSSLLLTPIVTDTPSVPNPEIKLEKNSKNSTVCNSCSSSSSFHNSREKIYLPLKNNQCNCSKCVSSNNSDFTSVSTITTKNSSSYYSSKSKSRERIGIKRGKKRSNSSSSFSSRGGSERSRSSSSFSSVTLDPAIIPLKVGCLEAPSFAAFADIHYRLNFRSSLDSYAEPTVVYEWNTSVGSWITMQTSIVIFPTPFAHGNMRASYYIIDLNRLNCRMVAKRYIRSSINESQYFDDVAMHTISNHWARRFNSFSPPKPVHFVPAAVLELTNRQPPMIFAVEPLLEGEFKKHNNNNGYVSKEARWTPQAFSHFTYQASNKKLMIVDIQGVGDIYTDPQILTFDGKGYGRGNLGKKGIRRFLRTHKCNGVCRMIGLPQLGHERKDKDTNSGVLSPKIHSQPYENSEMEILPPRSHGPRAPTSSTHSSVNQNKNKTNSNKCCQNSPVLSTAGTANPSIPQSPIITQPHIVSRGGSGLLQKMRVYVSRHIFNRNYHDKQVNDNNKCSGVNMKENSFSVTNVDSPNYSGSAEVQNTLRFTILTAHEVISPTPSLRSGSGSNNYKT